MIEEEIKVFSQILLIYSKNKRSDKWMGRIKETRDGKKTFDIKYEI